MSATYATRSATVVLIILAYVGGAFGTGFLGEAGADSYRALRKFVSGLRSRTSSDVQVVVEDDEGLRVILGPVTPDDALLELPEDLADAAGESGELHWNPDTHEWESSF